MNEKGGKAKKGSIINFTNWLWGYLCDGQLIVKRRFRPFGELHEILTNFQKARISQSDVFLNHTQPNIQFKIGPVRGCFSQC